MKFPFSNNWVEELGPLRDLRSPLSTSAIREGVLERAASPALWEQLKHILAEVLVVGVASAFVFRLSVPVARQGLPPTAYQVAHSFVTTHVSDGTNRSDRTNGENGERGKISIILFSQPGIAKDIPISLVNAATLSVTPFILHSSSFNLSSSFLHPSSFNHPPSRVWFASASGGAVFAHLRMLGKRGEVGCEDGWKTIILSYTNSDGNRDLRDAIAHHMGSTTPLLSSERNQEFSMLLGATAHTGPFELRAMAGPAYLSSFNAYFNSATGTTSPPVSLQGFGAAAEVSALYQWNSSFEIGVNGMANYLPRQFTSGLFASLEYRFGS